MTSDRSAGSRASHNKTSDPKKDNDLASTFTTGSAKSETFTTLAFAPTLIALIFLGIVQIIVSRLFAPGIIFGVLALFLGYFSWEWFDIFGTRLTRVDQVIFNEASILETTQAFEFTNGPMDDDITPFAPPKDAEKSLTVAALFANSNDKSMQEFYKKHYGQVYQQSVKAQMDLKATELAAKPLDQEKSEKKGAKSPPSSGSKKVSKK